MRQLASLAVLLLLCAGCGSVATRQGFYQPITAELRSGNAEQAADLIEKAREDNKYGEKDRFIYFVDAGLARHYAGQYQLSNTKLELAEVSAEELFTKSISRAAASLILNDNVLEYAGEDYEILYTNLIKALNYINLGDLDDAFVEIRRSNIKLNALEQKYADASRQLQQGNMEDSNRVQIDYEVEKVRFYNDAFARYLSMHMYAAEGKWDDARIDHDYLRDAFHSQPHIYDFPMPEVQYRASEGTIVSVVALVGLAPVKDDVSLRIRTDKDLNLVQVLYDSGDKAGAEYAHLPVPVSEDYYFKFAIPRLEPRPSAISAVEVTADGETIGRLQLLEDVTKVAQETFNAKKSLIFIRSVARAIVKGLAAHKAKEKVDTGGLGGWLKKAAIDVGTDLIENADLRCTQFLPGRVFVADFEMPTGTYEIGIRFLDYDGKTIDRYTYTGFEAAPRGLNMLEVHSLQ